MTQLIDGSGSIGTIKMNSNLYAALYIIVVHVGVLSSPCYFVCLLSMYVRRFIFLYRLQIVLNSFLLQLFAGEKYVYARSPAL